MKKLKPIHAIFLLSTFGVVSLGALPLFPLLEIVTPAEAASISKIGDLLYYRAIVVDTASMVDKGDLDGAKTRIKELEISWDEAEPSLKPRSPAEWHTIDKAIDRALSALRSNAPDTAASKQSLSALLALMHAAGGKP
jgi:hypothetical protein